MLCRKCSHTARWVAESLEMHSIGREFSLVLHESD